MSGATTAVARVNLSAIQEYEAGLVRQLLAGLKERPRFKVWGIKKADQGGCRAPTIAITDKLRLAVAIGTTPGVSGNLCLELRPISML